jgi:hypothetical protein
MPDLPLQEQETAMESSSSSVGTDLTDRSSAFSVICDLTQLQELSTLPGPEEDGLGRLRGPVELAALHGRPTGEPPPARRPRARHTRGLETAPAPPAKVLSGPAGQEKGSGGREAAGQGETIDRLRRRELFLAREASCLDSELRGLHRSMNTVLEDNLKLKTEVLQLRYEKEAGRSPKKEPEPADGRREVEEVVARLREEVVEQAARLDGQERQLAEGGGQLAKARGEAAGLAGEADRARHQAEQAVLANRTLQQVRRTGGSMEQCHDHPCIRLLRHWRWSWR